VKRSPIRSVSRRKAGTAIDRESVREQVFARDRWTCQFPKPHRCFGGLTFHHVLKASAGGTYSAENGLSLCVWANDWVEDHPDEAVRLGLVKRRKPLPEERANAV